MTQLTTSLILTGDERALTAALQRGEASLDGFNAATRRTGDGMKSARDSATAFQIGLDQQRASISQVRASLDPLYRSSMQYEAVQNEVQRAVATGAATQTEANRIMAMAEAQYLATGRSAQVMSGANRVAAGSMGNIVAQFNDIGVMMAAGQSPIQLALQQGTQLNQVFATMGGGTTVLRSIGTAAMSMVNPISLATIGVIAGGAALTQWGMSALNAEEETDALTEAIAKLNEEAADAATKVRLFLTGAGSVEDLTILEEVARLNREIAAARAEAETQTGRTAGGSRIRAQVLIEERDALVALLEERDREVAQAEQLDRIQEQANRAGAAYRDRLEAEKIANDEAERLVSTLNDQAALQVLIAQFGEESAAVASLRAQQERQVFIEQTNSRDISEELKEELIASWDAANGIAAAGMSDNISGAVTEAAKLASQLGIAYEMAARMTALGPQGISQADENGLVYSGRGGDPTKQGGRAIDWQTRDVDDFLSTYKAPSTSSGRSAGGSKGSKDQERIIREIEREFARLESTYERDVEAIQRWRDEALASLDPAKAGYEAFADDVAVLYDLKLAEAYENDLERRDDWAAGVERGLLKVRDDMITFADVSENLVTEWSSGLEDAFVQMVSTGKFEIGDLVDYTLEQFARLAYQQAIQPGVEAGFGFLTDLVGSAFGLTATQSHAGSQIGTSGVQRTYGSGAPLRADERLTVTTLGQRVFTPEQIANGSTVVDALAKAAQGNSGQGAGVVFAPSIQIENRGSVPVQGEVQERSDGSGGRSYKLVLSDEVGSALTQRGGGARKALQTEYGVRQRGVPR